MPTESNDKLDYDLYKFSKFISEEMINNGQFIVIKKYNKEDGVNRNIYYVYPIFKALKEEDQDQVKEYIESLMKSKKCPEGSIGYSCSFYYDGITKEQENWRQRLDKMDEDLMYTEAKELSNKYKNSTTIA